MIIFSAYLLLILYTLPLSDAEAEFMTSNCTAIIRLPAPLYTQAIHCHDKFSLIINKTLIIKNNDTEEEEYVSKLVATIVEIYVINTDVQSISLDASMDLMEKLYLTNNSIKSLSKNTFGSLPNLEQLDISRNQLEDNDIPAFHDLPSLKLLNLSHNNFKTIDSNSFGSLSKLEILDLSHNGLYRISTTLVGSDHKNLRTLYLHNNQLLTVNLKVHALKYIDASFNIIRSVNLPDLLKLNLNNNKIRDLISFSDVEINVSNNNITKFRASSEDTVSISASYNQIVTITRSFFLNSKRLQYLDLSNNIITHIEKNALVTLEQIKTINLSRNKISDFKFRVFDGLNTLEILDISYNNFVNFYHIPSVGLFSFRNVSSLGKIILNNNQRSCNFFKQLSRKTRFGMISPQSSCTTDINDFIVVFEKIAPIVDYDEKEMVETVPEDLEIDFSSTTISDYISSTTTTQTSTASKKSDAILILLILIKLLLL